MPNKPLNTRYKDNHFSEDAGTSIFREIFDDHYSPLCFFAEKLLKDQPAAEDLVEDVFIKLWLKEPDFSKYKNIKAVLYIAVKNACLDFIKADHRNLVKNVQWAYTKQQETETFVLNEMIYIEVVQEIYAELHKLPRECRNIMQLLFIDGWDNKKIADYLDVSIHTIKKHKLKGIQTLRKRFATSIFLLVTITYYLLK